MQQNKSSKHKKCDITTPLLFITSGAWNVTFYLVHQIDNAYSVWAQHHVPFGCIFRYSLFESQAGHNIFFLSLIKSLRQDSESFFFFLNIKP